MKIVLLFFILISIKLIICDFGLEERKRVINKCTEGISSISTIKADTYTYDYVMNHCLNFNIKFLNREYRFLYYSKYYRNENEFYKLLHKPHMINTKFIKKIFHLNPTNLITLHYCFKIEKLSSKFFYLKTKSLKEDRITEAKLSIFYNWLKTNGAQFNKVDIYSDLETGMRGLYALDDIHFNENIVYIPDKIMISCDKTGSSVVSKRIRQFYDDIPDYEIFVLSLFIIEEAYKPDSFWKPFIDILPKNLDNFPINYSEDELSLFKDHRLYRRIMKLKEKMKKFYNIICEISKGYFEEDYCSIVTYEVFVWALTNIKSRGFSFSRRRLDIAGISPFSDFLNHSSDNVTILWRYSANYEGFLLYGVRNNYNVEEVFTSYGFIGNEWLLFNYGFALENNPYDEIQINLELPLEDKNYILKYMLMEKRGIKSNSKCILSMDIESAKTQKFLSLLRFMYYQENLTKYLDTQYEIQNEGRKKIPKKIKRDVLVIDYLHDNDKDNEEYNFDPYNFAAVDIQQEINMLKNMKVILINKLSEFFSNLSDDIEMYETNQQYLSQNFKNIFLYKISQKKVLLFFIEFCDKMQFLFKFKKYDEFINYYENHMEDYKGHHHYIYHVVDYLLGIYRND